METQFQEYIYAPKKSKVPKVIIITMVAIISFLVICIGLYALDSVNYIESIKQERFNNSDYTFGEAFDRHFNGDWEYFVTDEGQDVVQFDGYDEGGFRFTTQWTITPLENDEFWYEMTYCSYAGESLLDDGWLGYGAAAIGLSAIMNN